jgi:hypothetical protein
MPTTPRVPFRSPGRQRHRLERGRWLFERAASPPCTGDGVLSTHSNAPYSPSDRLAELENTCHRLIPVVIPKARSCLFPASWSLDPLQRYVPRSTVNNFRADGLRINDWVWVCFRASSSRFRWDARSSDVRERADLLWVCNRTIIIEAEVTSARTRAAISRHFHWRRACVAQRDTWCAHPFCD